MTVDINQLKIGDVVPVPPKPKSEQQIMANWQGNLSKPLVSIVCHTFNHVNYIKDALNGFLMQETDFPFEIILHDDASTDGTTEIVKEYAQAYPNIIVPIIQTENQWSLGVTPRVFTFPQVRGKYIALCEGDDYWISTTKIQKQIDSFLNGVSLVFHDSIRIEGSLITNVSYYVENQKPLNGYTPYQMVRGSRIPTASAVFLSKPFQGTKQISIMNGDHLLWATLASHGSATLISENWSIYRRHSSSVWSSRKVIDKIAPALESRRTIFNMVPSEFKNSALLGYLLTGIELLDGTLKEKDREIIHSLKRTIFIDYCTMLRDCSFKSTENIIEFLRVQKKSLKIPAMIIRYKLK